jgi:hypothetical protein
MVVEYTECFDARPTAIFDGDPDCGYIEYEGLQALYMTNFDADGLGSDTMRVSFDGIYNPPVAMEVGEVSGTQDGIKVYFFDENDDEVEDPCNAYAVSYYADEVYTGIEMTFSTDTNGDNNTINIDIATLPHKLVVGSVMRLVLPAYNQNYIGYGV